jgi:hypothetical protein
MRKRFGFCKIWSFWHETFLLSLIEKGHHVAVELREFYRNDRQYVHIALRSWNIIKIQSREIPLLLGVGRINTTFYSKG